ncbi:hypothetical protein GCM10022211_09130 [Sphingomonas humi]|uniref:Ice-binding protein C-terminal domain-containing protein n=1 Tax=Sphingomonas humi TaxID=335630 RepID=A0ABP7RQ48_9SPHN
MKMLKLTVAAAIAATALPSAASAASIVTTGNLATTVANTKLDIAATNPNNFTIGFSDADLANPFNELLTFTTDVAGILNINVLTSATSLADNVTFSSVSLFGGSIGGAPGTSLVQVRPDPNDTFGFANNTINIGAGTYTLNIQGTPGSQNGSFGGSVAFSQTAAVPEPGTWALMLIGFGAVGFSMRRRRATAAHLYQAA